MFSETPSTTLGDHLKNILRFAINHDKIVQNYFIEIAELHINYATKLKQINKKYLNYNKKLCNRLHCETGLSKIWRDYVLKSVNTCDKKIDYALQLRSPRHRQLLKDIEILSDSVETFYSQNFQQLKECLEKSTRNYSKRIDQVDSAKKKFYKRLTSFRDAAAIGFRNYDLYLKRVTRQKKLFLDFASRNNECYIDIEIAKVYRNYYFHRAIPHFMDNLKTNLKLLLLGRIAFLSEAFTNINEVCNGVDNNLAETACDQINDTTTKLEYECFYDNYQTVIAQHKDNYQSVINIIEKNTAVTELFFADINKQDGNDRMSEFKNLFESCKCEILEYKKKEREMQAKIVPENGIVCINKVSEINELNKIRADILKSEIKQRQAEVAYELLNKYCNCRVAAFRDMLPAFDTPKANTEDSKEYTMDFVSPYNLDLSRNFELLGQPWFSGILIQDELRNILQYPTDFVVRVSRSLSEQGKPVLLISCYNEQGEINECVIRVDNTSQGIKKKKFYLDVDPMLAFNNVSELIDFYRKSGNSIFRDRYLPIVDYPLTNDKKVFEIQEDDLTIRDRQLGAGNSSVVKLGVLRTTGQMVAIKCPCPSSDTDANVVTEIGFRQELQILRQCQHLNIVQLIAICCVTDGPYLICELMQNGDLHLRLKFLHEIWEDSAKDPIEKGSIFQLLMLYAVQIANGLAYLHDRDIIHRDLAARNCLLDDKDYLKIADFGLARQLVNGKYDGSKDIFPWRITPPEIILSNQQKIFTCQSDIWSYGVLLWEIFSFGAIPYEEEMRSSGSLAKIKDFHKQGNQLKNPLHATPAINEVFNECLSFDGNRPAIKTVASRLRHELTKFYLLMQQNREYANAASR